jgi:hypothetical protein
VRRTVEMTETVCEDCGLVIKRNGPFGEPLVHPGYGFDGPECVLPEAYVFVEGDNTVSDLCHDCYGNARRNADRLTLTGQR